MNREVNLTKRVQTPHGWRYCRVVLSANGRIKPDLVIVNDKEQCHKEGAYYIEWREGAKRTRLSVGKTPADASARRQRKEAVPHLDPPASQVSHDVVIVGLEESAMCHVKITQTR